MRTLTDEDKQQMWDQFERSLKTTTRLGINSDIPRVFSLFSNHRPELVDTRLLPFEVNNCVITSNINWDASHKVFWLPLFTLKDACLSGFIYEFEYPLSVVFLFESGPDGEWKFIDNYDFDGVLSNKEIASDIASIVQYRCESNTGSVQLHKAFDNMVSRYLKVYIEPYVVEAIRNKMGRSIARSCRKLIMKTLMNYRNYWGYRELFHQHEARWKANPRLYRELYSCLIGIAPTAFEQIAQSGPSFYAFYLAYDVICGYVKKSPSPRWWRVLSRRIKSTDYKYLLSNRASLGSIYVCEGNGYYELISDKKLKDILNVSASDRYRMTFVLYRTLHDYSLLKRVTLKEESLARVSRYARSLFRIRARYYRVWEYVDHYLRDTQSIVQSLIDSKGSVTADKDVHVLIKEVLQLFGELIASSSLLTRLRLAARIHHIHREIQLKTNPVPERPMFPLIPALESLREYWLPTTTHLVERGMDYNHCLATFIDTADKPYWYFDYKTAVAQVEYDEKTEKLVLVQCHGPGNRETHESRKLSQMIRSLIRRAGKVTDQIIEASECLNDSNDIQLKKVG